MSHFGGHPQDILVDPASHGPTVGAHVYIYASDPRDGTAEAVTDLTKVDGTPYPGYVISDDGGRIEFLTANNYLTVWGVDPVNRTYRYDSWDLLDDAATAGEQYPAMQTAVDKATSDAADAKSDAADAKAAAQEALANFGLQPLVDQLQTPFYIAHRGGRARFPEHSMEAYDQAANGGFLIEPDLRPLKDGTTLVACHDASVTRTMTGISGNVTANTPQQWARARIKSGAFNGNTGDPDGGDQGTPVFWEKALDKWGGRFVMVPEIKDASAQQQVIDSIKRRHLERCVIVQSFDFTVAKAVAAEGIATLFLWSGASTTQTWADIKAAGIEFVGPQSGITQTDIAAAHAAGLKVIVWTVDDPDTADDLISRGVDGMFSDDPWYISRQFPQQQSDPFAERWVWPGGSFLEGVESADTAPDKQFTWNQAARGELHVDVDSGSTAASITRSSTQLWAGEIDLSQRYIAIDMVLKMDQPSSALDRWFGIYLGTGKAGKTYGDVFLDDGAGGYTEENGYHILYRYNGIMSIYRVDGGAATKLDELQGVGFTVGQGIRRVRTTFNSTNVAAYDLADGSHLSVADNTYRGKAMMALSRSGMSGTFSGININVLT